MYGCHLGQSLDLSVGVGALPRAAVYHTVATTTALKTGALMELTARLGALAAGAVPTRVEALARFGRRLGIGLQMLDDFGNLNTPHADDGNGKALEDLRNGRPTWPWALAAEELDEPEFARLQASARALVPGADPAGTRARALAAALRLDAGTGPPGGRLWMNVVASRSWGADSADWRRPSACRRRGSPPRCSRRAIIPAAALTSTAIRATPSTPGRPSSRRRIAWKSCSRWRASGWRITSRSSR